MNFKTTLALLALLALVACYFIFVERDAQTSYERQRLAAEASDVEGTPLLDEDLDAEQVEQLTIERDGRTVVLKKSGEEWTQVRPVRFALNSWTTQSVVDAALGLRYLERFQPGEDGAPTLADLGLESPRVTVTLGSGDDAPTLHLGKRSLAGHGYLTRPGDDHVYVVNDDLHDQLLDAKVEAWRKKTLASPSADRAQRVTIARPSGEVTLVKQDGRWFLDEAGMERASASAVSELLSAVSTMRIEEFVADAPQDPGLFGLDSPRIVFTVQAPELAAEPAATQPAEPAAQTYTLRIGGPADLKNEAYFATWSTGDEPSPVVFTVPGPSVEKLTQPVDELREPRLLTADAQEVRELRVTRPDEPDLHLVRDTDRGFTFGDSDPGYGVDYDAATDFIANLTATEATGYRANFTPSGEPIAVAELTLRGAGLTETLRVYPAEAGEGYLAVRGDEPVAYRVAADELAPLFAGRLALRDKELLHLPAGQIAQLTLERADGATFTFVRDAAATQPAAGHWSLQGEATMEQAALEGLLNALAPLRVERWLAETVELPGSWATLTIEPVEGSPRVLRVDPETGRAVMSDVETGFVLPQAFVDRLRAEYRDRTVLPLSLEAIESVTLGTGEQAVTLRRDADQRYVAEGDATVDQAAAGALFDTLAGLRVERYVTPPAEGAATVQRTLTIAGKGGQSFTLELVQAGDQTLGRLGEQWFTVDDETRKAVSAQVVTQGGETRADARG